MSYIGNEPLSVAFLTDTFSGNGSTVAFTMSVAPANTSSILVAVTGVVQDPSTYSVSGTTLTFSAAPPTGTSNISVRYLGIPASGVTTTAYRTVTDTTATTGQTTFTIPSYTVGYVDVFRNGVRLAAADFTATTGTTIVLASGASAGDTITTVSFYVSSVLNAIPATAGSVGTANLGAITNIASGNSNMTLQTGASNTTAVTVDTAQNVGVGVTPSAWTLKAIDISTFGGFYGFNNQAGITSNAYYGSAGWIYKNNGAATLYQQIGGAHNWFTAVSGTAGNVISLTQAMTLDISGNLLVATTNSADTAGVGLKIRQVSTQTQVSSVCSGSLNTYVLYNTTAGAFRFYVSEAGQIFATSTSITAISDQTLKENVRDLETGLTEVMALQPRRFDWKNGDATNVAGFIAQEVEQVLPELVTDYVYNKDEEGNDITKKSLKMGDILPTLVKAIQEQQSIIEQLKADVAALKGQA